ncbi:kinesin-like protein CG14535 [Bacillus rossius redtenbacheri]|uniref:kinesin-like protein CG14535 n=1 Tax=Bacillus rossius redtenbacheri TaxID=93214 RepID=UPI002FDDDC18
MPVSQLPPGPLQMGTSAAESIAAIKVCTTGRPSIQVDIKDTIEFTGLAVITDAIRISAAVGIAAIEVSDTIEVSAVLDDAIRFCTADGKLVNKVRVMLKVSGGATLDAALSVDRRKKQVTLADPSSPSARSPGLFAFDAVFTDDDPPVDVCSHLLTEALHAVINGTDGCFLSFGAPLLGRHPGVEACAAAWLFRGVAERRQRSGARFSVRVSAVEVCAAGVARDLLQPYAGAEGEQPPGAYLREQPASQLPSELRAPSAERAAHYLAAALAARSSPAAHLVLTLHVYQYSVAGPRGAVAGGRSRLHLVEAGDCRRARGKDMSLSALGSVLLAVFSGHKHLPHRDHKLTQLLKDCFSSLMCHTTVVAHVSPLSCHHADTLATLQLSARLHRIRHRKIKFFGPSVICSYKKPDSSQPTEGSDVEPSSSEQSADTVIYLGATDDATDGEHPPTRASNLGTKDSRCLSGKTSTAAKHEENKPDEVAENGAAVCGDQKPPGMKNASCRSFPARVGRNPLTRSLSPRKSALLGEDPAPLTSDEQWVDGPRIPKSRVAEALDLQEETWVDGPLQDGGAPGYGFMDEHKELMIRSWVENQTSHTKKSADARAPEGRDGPTATDAAERGDQKLTSPDTGTSLVPTSAVVSNRMVTTSPDTGTSLVPTSAVVSNRMVTTSPDTGTSLVPTSAVVSNRMVTTSPDTGTSLVPTSAVVSNHIITMTRDSADRISQLNKGHSSTPETLVAYNDEVMDTNSQKSGREISIGKLNRF